MDGRGQAGATAMGWSEGGITFGAGWREIHRSNRGGVKGDTRERQRWGGGRYGSGRIVSARGWVRGCCRGAVAEWRA